MTSLRLILMAALSIAGLAAKVCAQETPMADWEMEPLSDDGWISIDYVTQLAEATNGVMVKYSGAVLTANRVALNLALGEALADGNVQIQYAEQTWAGEHILYNFKTHQMEARQFRTGKAPVFVEGEGLHAEWTNKVYVATNAFITTDDIAGPAVRVRAKYIKIIPGKRIEARHAFLYAGKVPIFYFPYYSRNLGPRANNFNFLPGYRSSFGPFLLSSYNWFLSEELSGALNLDYRERRGVGAGPDFDFNVGRWGKGTLSYYYLYDQDPTASLESLTNSVSDNRQRLNLGYQAAPYTNLSIRSMVRWQSDVGVLHDFFETEYRQNPEPSTFVEATRTWQNFSLDLYVQPRVNPFFETVERLPDLRLTGFRQQLLSTPVFYESESSAGYYRRRFGETNVLFPTMGPYGPNDYAAARADTYHQLLLPQTFFGWLNITPRAGGRLSYYSRATGPGAITDEKLRGVFNTGAEASFKASRVWPGVQSKAFELDGLRHIIEPSVNYVYVPEPNYSGTNNIPQFDFELPSLRLLPIDFPDYNSIDSIDSQNVMRFGIHNKLQTKRRDQVVTMLDWNLYTDWRLRPNSSQSTFADIYSDFLLHPRSWIYLESLLRYNISGGQFRLSFHALTLQPNDVWSLTLSHYYLEDDLRPVPTALGEGNNLLSTTIFYKLNENWGFRASLRFDARDGRLQEQSYGVYRDLRNWTAALTFRLRDNLDGPDDFGVAFTFSLKAFPRFGFGQDRVRSSTLLGNQATRDY